MPIQTRYLLHENGPALWPEHKPLKDILDLKRITPPNIWSSTYQGQPTAPEGTIFKRSMFAETRYDHASVAFQSRVIARYISFDTANKDGIANAYTAGVVGELMADYTLAVREVRRDRLEFPDLIPFITSMCRRYNDGRTRAVIIEDKASGTSAYQSLRKSSDGDIAALLTPFAPDGDKERRANQAAIWCSNFSVYLPQPGNTSPWLHTFEDELFSFPGSEFADQVDAFSQLVIYCENLLAEGLRARSRQHIEEPTQ